MTELATRINSYLSFVLGEEIFAAKVCKVLNILEMTRITKVPEAPFYLKGIINLRGTVLPIIDTRLKFDMTETRITHSTCIIVLEISEGKDKFQIGAVVDGVQAVIEIDDDVVLPSPDVGTGYEMNFIEGVYKDEDEFIMMLNIDLIFTSDELVGLRNFNMEEHIESVN